MFSVLKAFLFLSIAVSSINSGESFFDHLVSDHGPHSYYLVINFDSPDYQGKATIENHLLFHFLYRTQGRLPEAKYESFAKDLLVNKSWLKTKTINLQRWGFRKVTRITAVDDVAAKGKEEFLKYYFAGKAGRVIKEGVSDDEKVAIIERLFAWQIATSHDDETGLLFFTEFKDVGARTPPTSSEHATQAVAR